MLKLRVIPVLSFNGFGLVKTKQFTNPRMVGNPMQAARVYNSRNVDELVFVDIFASNQKRKVNLAVVKQVINECFMPVSIGGGINTVSDINDLLQIGADKVVLKTCAIINPSFITEASKIFGAQCLVLAVDIIKTAEGLKIYSPFNNNSIDATDFIKCAESLGAGELLINDVNNDGMMSGFDTELFKEASNATNLPIIAAGGAGVPKDFLPLLQNKNITGLAGASIFHYTQYTPFDIKYTLNNAGYPIRLFDNHLKEGVNI